MRSYITASACTFMGLVLATPALAAGGDFSAETLVEPQFWVAAVSALAMVGLAAGNGIGSRKKAAGPKPYADQLTRSHPQPGIFGELA